MRRGSSDHDPCENNNRVLSFFRWERRYQKYSNKNSAQQNLFLLPQPRSPYTRETMYKPWCVCVCVCMYTQLSLPSPWILIKPAGRRLGEEEEEEGGGGRRRSSRQQQRQPATAASDVCERYRYLVEGICVELAYNRRADLLIRNPAYTCPESCILCANTIFSGRLLSLSAPVGPYRWYARILRSSKFLHLGRGEGRQAGKSSRQAD